jgi:PLAT/LH2 domain
VIEAGRRLSVGSVKTKLLVALLVALPATQASALPKPPGTGEFPPFDFDPGDPWPQPPVDPGGPDPLPPLYANPPRVIGRSDHDVTLTWSSHAAAAAVTALERSTATDGAYTQVQCWYAGAGPGAVMQKKGGVPTGECLAGPQPASYADGGRSLDSFYCYRITVSDGVGGSVSSSPVCAYTRGFVVDPKSGSGADQPWEAKLVVDTANLVGAGTDNDIRVGLNDYMSNISPHGNETWVDYPDDDFEAGSTFEYQLALGTLEDRHDIEKLALYKTGDDAWCVERVQLKVNTRVVFEQSFEDEPDGCLWLTSELEHNALLEVSHDQLRASPDWQAFVPTGPGFSVPAFEIISRIESAVGNLAHYTELYWNEDDDGVWLSRVDDDTLHVEVQATAYAEHWADPTVRLDLDADVVVACTPHAGGFLVEVAFEPRDADVSAEGVLFEVGEFFYCAFEADWNCIEEAISDGVLGGLPSFPSGSLQLPVCPSTTIDEFGQVNFVI